MPRIDGVRAVIGVGVVAVAIGFAVRSHVGAGNRAGPSATSGGAAEVIKKLGAVPIALPRPTVVHTIRPGHFTLLTMGDTVNVVVASGGTAQLRGLGPTFPLLHTGATPISSATGTMHVAITGEVGTVTLEARDFVGTNEEGKRVPLAVTGPARVTVHAGQHAVLRFAGTFDTGDGALSYLPSGGPTVTWDFSVELD